MLTAAEIRDIEFPKATMGGYKQADVDHFLMEFADVLENSIKENADLIRKLQILAEKIEEYRSEEDSIKSALLNAQKTADKVLREAKAEAERITNASAEEAKMNKAKASLEAEEISRAAAIKSNDIIANTEEKMKKQLSAYNFIKAEIAAFKTTTIEHYKAHVEMINSVPEMSKNLKDYEAQAQALKVTKEIVMPEDNFDDTIVMDLSGDEDLITE